MTCIAVTTILIVVMLGGRLVKYFGLAAYGQLDGGVLLTMVAMRIPGFLTLILPLGFFVGLMLVFSRMYVDHEMDVLASSGISRQRLALMLWPIVVVMVLCEAALSLWVGPWGERQSEKQFATQAVRSAFDLVKPKEFVTNGAYTIYVESISDDRQTLDGIFVYQRATEHGKPDVLITAKQAKRVVDETQRSSIVDLTQGRRYELVSGSPQYTRAEFEYYRLMILQNMTANNAAVKLELKTVDELYDKRHDAPVKAELGWRIGIVLSMLVAVLLAVPLSKVSPRQGRFLRLIPSVLLFVSSVVALMAVKSKVAQGTMSYLVFLVIMLGYGVLGVVLDMSDRLSLWKGKAAKADVGAIS